MRIIITITYEYAMQFSILVRDSKKESERSIWAQSVREIYFEKSDILVNIFATNNQSRCYVFDASASENNLIYFCEQKKKRYLQLTSLAFWRCQCKWKVTKIKCIWMSTEMQYKPLMSQQHSTDLSFESCNSCAYTNSMSFHAVAYYILLLC